MVSALGTNSRSSALKSNQLSRKFRQSLRSAIRPTRLDCNFVARIAGFTQTLTNCSNEMSGIRSARGPEKPNHRRCLLLRPYAKRPDSRRTSEKTDELAPPHCLPRGSGQHILQARTGKLEAASLLLRAVSLRN